MKNFERLKELAKQSKTFEAFLAEVSRFVHWYEVPNVGTKADYQAFWIENKEV